MHYIYLSLFVIFSQSLYSNDGTLEISLKRAMDSFKVGNYQNSEKVFSELLEKNPQNTVIRFNYANNLFVLKKYKKAIGNYKAVIKSKSNLSPIAKLYMAKSYKEIGELKRALSIVNKLLLTKLPQNIRKLIIEEKEYLKLQKESSRFKQAYEHFKKQEFQKTLDLLKDTERDEAVYIKGLSHFKLKDKAAAKREFQKIVDLELKATALSLLGDEKTFWSELGSRVFFGIDLSMTASDNTNLTSGTTGDRTHAALETYNSASMGIDIQRSKTSKLNIYYNATYEQTMNDGDSWSLTHSYNVSWSKISPEWIFKLKPSYEMQYDIGGSYLDKQGIEATLKRKFSRNAIGLRTSIYQQIKPQLNTEYLKGHYTRSGAYYIFTSGRFGLQVDIGFNKFEYTDTSTIVISNQETTQLLDFFLSLGEKWSVSANMYFSQKNYILDKLNSIKREDKLSSYKLGLSRDLSDFLSAYFDISYSKNNSNINSIGNIKSYQQYSSTVGIIMSL